MTTEQLLIKHMARWAVQLPNPTKEQIVLAQPRTMTVSQVSEKTGITKEYVRTTAHRHGFAFAEGRKRAEVGADYRPLNEIAEQHGISKSWACRLRGEA